MSLITFTSTNPNLSYLVYKNPSSGALVKEVRAGRMFGWFTPGTEGTQYNVLFKDSDTEVSYKTHPDETFEHVNATRYNSAMFVINALSEYFGSALKKPAEQDTEDFEHTAVINMMYIKDLRYVDIFARHFDDYTIEAQARAHNNYRVTITTKRKFSQLLSFINLFCMFNVIKNEQDYFDVSDGVVIKYMACLQNIDAPYFVRYVFKVNLLRGKAMFRQYQKQLETSGRYKEIKMTLGNTSMARRTEVLKVLGRFERPIIDFGCGDGFYAQYIAPRMEGLPYYAMDKDPEVLESLKWRAERKEITNIIPILNDLEEGNRLPSEEVGDESVDVLAIEVIEHMPLAKAQDNLKSILTELNVNSLVITTPNKEFNQYYTHDEGDMRHDDHHFELTEAEFLRDIVGPLMFHAAESLGRHYAVSVSGIGDKVDGQHSSLMAVFTLAKNQVTENAV